MLAPLSVPINVICVYLHFFSIRFFAVTQSSFSDLAFLFFVFVIKPSLYFVFLHIQVAFAYLLRLKSAFRFIYKITLQIINC